VGRRKSLKRTTLRLLPAFLCREWLGSMLDYPGLRATSSKLPRIWVASVPITSFAVRSADSIIRWRNTSTISWTLESTR
jgi:hypothetical protein